MEESSGGGRKSNTVLSISFYLYTLFTLFLYLFLLLQYHYIYIYIYVCVWKMEINPTVCKYKNMKKQNIQRRYLFIYDDMRYIHMPMFNGLVFVKLSSGQY